ncbi:MAG: hypothetical protein HQM10_03455 [Candidatus Riflebacteria bacterium]|nr:hypothetical protein [Candidatus Riflebacteria bacterium]
MTTTNGNDPVENLLLNQPLEKAPAEVYSRLQKRAVWNQPRHSPIKIIIGLTALLIVIVSVFVFYIQDNKSEENTLQQTFPGNSNASSAEVIARAIHVSMDTSNESIAREIGGFSSIWLVNEAPFVSGFGSEVNISSLQQDTFDS